MHTNAYNLHIVFYRNITRIKIINVTKLHVFADFDSKLILQYAIIWWT